MADEHIIELVRADGLTLIAKGDSGHWVTLDSAPEFDGYDAATRPFELFLTSIAGCTAMDVLSILKKMKVDVRDFRMKLSAKRRNEHPKVPTEIKIKYIFKGEKLPKNMIEKAIRLSQDKYCSVSAVVKMAGIPVKWSYKLIQGE